MTGLGGAGAWPAAFALTLLVETAVLVRLLGERPLTAGWALVVNAVTHPLFWMSAAGGLAYEAWTLAAEVVIAAAEGAALAWLLADRRALAGAALANIHSFMSGALLLGAAALANAPHTKYRTPPPITQVGAPAFFAALAALLVAALSGPVAVHLWARRRARRGKERLRGKSLWLRLVPAALLWLFALLLTFCAIWLGPYGIALAPAVPVLLLVALPFFGALHARAYAPTRSGKT